MSKTTKEDEATQGCLLLGVMLFMALAVWGFFGFGWAMGVIAVFCFLLFLVSLL